MAELYLVRHAQASFGTDDYDRLSELGHRVRVATGRSAERLAQVADGAVVDTVVADLAEPGAGRRVVAEAAAAADLVAARLVASLAKPGGEHHGLYSNDERFERETNRALKGNDAQTVACRRCFVQRHLGA